MSSISKNMWLRQEERRQELPTLCFVRQQFDLQQQDDNGFILEQPLVSAMLKDGESPMAEPQDLPHVCKGQRADQCSHGCNKNGTQSRRTSSRRRRPRDAMVTAAWNIWCCKAALQASTGQLVLLSIHTGCAGHWLTMCRHTHTPEDLSMWWRRSSSATGASSGEQLFPSCSMSTFLKNAVVVATLGEKDLEDVFLLRTLWRPSNDRLARRRWRTLSCIFLPPSC